MIESKIFSNQNLTEKVHYVYRVTIDGKYYIGKRSGLLNDLHTGAYATSSKLVLEKLQNGHHFSKIKILQVFSSSKDALEFESRILTRVNASTNPKFLNQHNGSGSYTCKGHTEKTKEKISKIAKAQFDPNTEEGRKRREGISKRGKERFNPETEQGRKQREIQSEISKAQFDINTEYGRKQREIQSEKGKERFNPETEQGRKQREIQSEIKKAQFDKNTEEGRIRRENKSQSTKAQFDINTEEGRKRRENHSKIQRNSWDENTEEGRKRRENKSQLAKAQFDSNTEEGRKQREIRSEIQRNNWNKNTEEGEKRREKQSQSAKAQFDPNTEQGRKNREHFSEIRIQKRIEVSILGDLLFDEAFIRENFLITDDKNNLRFLWSVYSKLSGYSESRIIVLKREGKLSFLYGIKSISISEEQELAKIEAIEAIIKSRNEELSLKAS